MSAYFLDTSVAGLILDGELHSREPHLLPRYMSELGFSCSSTSDIVSHPSVQRVVAAFEWSKAFRARGGRLLITPTVRVELDCAPQCERMDWVEDLGEVGIEDIHRLDLVVPPEDVDAAIARMLPELRAQIPTITTAQEESDLVPTLTLFGTQSLISKNRADFQIYMEACKAFSKFGVGRFLVTDDHKFFKLFLKSSVAEEALHTVCVRTLGIAQGVRVKLAGEVIQGV